MINKQYTIRLCEPYIDPYHGVDFTIEKNMYELLKCPPQKYVKTNSVGFADNAYSWQYGTYIPLTKQDFLRYQYIGYHSNDGAMTGLIDITDIEESELDKIADSERWLNLAEEYKLDWEKVGLLHSVRKNISPRILFVGRTYSGDVGASLYLYHDRNNSVSGVIINSEYWEELEG